MREHPILFSGEMVRAILDGRKRQTRRVVKPQPAIVGDIHDSSAWYWKGGKRLLDAGYGADYVHTTEDALAKAMLAASPWKVGDRLWVRETWARNEHKLTGGAHSCQVAYRADGRWGSCGGDWMFYPHGWTVGVTDKARQDWAELNGHWVGRGYFGKWRPSIHMPRWASRIMLEVTDVRAEHIQDITAEDVMAEGVQEAFGGYDMTDQAWVLAFHQFWDRVCAENHPWDSNPWVWVLEFKHVEKAR